MADHAIEKDYGHKPVLLQECLDALAIRPDGVYVDGTPFAILLVNLLTPFLDLIRPKPFGAR